MPKITVIEKDGSRQDIDAAAGLSVMEALRAADYPVYGECGGALACATCHVVIEEGWYARLPAPSEAEEDMLDTAFNLTATSRLCCQIPVGEDTDGLVVRLPG